MINAISRLVVRRARLVVILSVLFAVVAGAVGSMVIPRMSGGGYDDPQSDSAQVAQLLEQDFKVEIPHLSVVVGIPGERNAITSTQVQTEVANLAKDFESVNGVSRVDSWWSLGGRATALQSPDADLGLMLVYVDSKELDEQNKIAKTIIDETPRSIGDIQIYMGGIGAVYNGINGQITEDIKFAETVSIPLTLLMLLIVFGTAMAASMPLLVGVSAIAGALLGVYAVSLFTDVSVFALNLITGLGLGLGIDYSLLVVNRFREELARGKSVEDAIQKTVETAGRTVMISGATVALTLASLSLFPQPFLKSFAYAGVAVCLMAVLGALIPLPAAMRLLGPRIDKWRVRRGNLAPSDRGVWSTVARFVMKHPWVTSLSTVVVLFALATPALSAEFAQIDDRVLAKDNEVAVAAAILRDEFNSNESAPAHVVFDRATSESQVAKFARLASELPEVVRVETQNGLFRDGQFTPLGAAQGWPAATMETEDHQRVIVVADINSRSRAGQELIDSLRSIDSMVLVGGAAADYTDSQAGISRQLPWALLWVALTTFVVLFLYTGSILLPVKAILLNVLSLTATMGVLTWMFQYGNLMWLTGEYTVTSTLDSSSLVLIAIVTFGLSMDYEVFLLSRIKEEHDRGLDTTEAVALGLQRSGRIITAAAVLLAIVFGAFVTSSVTSMKMLGFGIAFAILMDATVVRGLLVPALMRIAGKYNWWAPKPLRAIHQRFGLQD